MTVLDAIGPYKIDQEVDPGHCTPVWRAVDTTTGKPVAIKAITKLSSAPQGRRSIKYEMDLQKELDFPFIAKLYDVIETPFCLYLVMELANGCSLADVVNQKGGFPETQIKSTFCQLIATLEYLHSRGVVHRDIKGENLMLDYNRNLKMIDFGLSQRKCEVKDGLFETLCGSYSYLAPELVKGEKYTEKVDIWASGVVLYTCLCGTLPFKDLSLPKLSQRILYADPVFPVGVSAEAVDLTKRMLCKDPAQRITIDEIKEHPWFDRAQYDKIQAIVARRESKEAKVQSDIERLGMNVEKCRDDVEKGEWTRDAAVYRILSREREMELLNQERGVKASHSGLIDLSKKPRPTMAAVCLVMKDVIGVKKNNTNGARPTKRVLRNSATKQAVVVSRVRAAKQDMFGVREVSVK